MKFSSAALNDEDVAFPFRLYNEAVIQVDSTLAVCKKTPKTAKPPAFQPWKGDLWFT